jgi:outer membrane cobalamin receptor
MAHPSMRSRRALTSGALATLVIAGALATTARPALAQHADTLCDTTMVSGHRLPCVRVVASPTKQADAANAVILTPWAIRTVPANDAWDIMRQAAGVQVHLQGQGPGFASDAAIRGFTSDHSTDVAMFVDGVPVNEPVSGHAEGYADWNALMPEVVSKISITKGPSSPWSGNFAMGGEVQVKSVPVATNTQWTLRAGSYGDARFSVRGGDADTLGGALYAADIQRATGWRDNSEQLIGHLMASKLWQRSDDPDRSFTLAASGYTGEWRSPGFITLGAYDSGNVTQATNPSDAGNEIFGTLRAALTRPEWSGQLESQLYVHGGMWHIFLTIPPEGGIGEGVQSQTEELDQRVGFGGDTRWSKQFESSHLIAELQYRAVNANYQRYYTSDRVRDSVFFFNDSVPATLDAWYVGVAPVVELHWDVTNALNLGIGARLDWLYYNSEQRGGGMYSADSRVIASPKLGALYQFTPSLSAWASYNGGFRSSDGVIVTPSLPPALENVGELGLRYNGGKVEGSVALFRVNVHNQQTVDPVTLQASSAGTTLQQGVEVDGSVGLAAWVSFFLHATVNDAHYVHLVSDGGDNLAGVPVYQVAKSTVEGGFDVEHGSLAGSLWAAYTGPWTPVNQPTVRTSGYTLLNLRAAVPLSGPWSAVLGIQNILDQRYVEVQASGFVSPGQPRVFMITLRHGV